MGNMKWEMHISNGTCLLVLTGMIMVSKIFQSVVEYYMLESTLRLAKPG